MTLATETASDPVIERVAERLTRRMGELLHSYRLPGASAGIVRDGRLAWHAGFGVADLESRRRTDERTLYRVASISKTFTATAIVQLRDAGRLGLDDPLVQHLPEFAAVRCQHGRVEDVTLRRLLSHRSGLISEGPFSYWDSMQFPEMAEILTRLPETEVVLAPDAGAKYSNLAFALLGEVVARLSGQPYEAYVRERILRPLGMEESGFAPEFEPGERLATGYSPHPFEDYPEPSGHTLCSGINAAAGLYTCVADLARWLTFQCTAAPSAVGPASDPTLDEQLSPEAKAGAGAVLAPRSLDEMHTPQAIDANWTAARCLGWMGQRAGERVFLGHGGSMHGFISQILFHKPSKSGAIVLTNEGRHEMAGQAAADLLNLLLDAEQEVSGPQQEAPPLPTPPEWRRFLGRYQLWAGALSHVEYRAGELRLEPAPPAQQALHAPSRLLPSDAPLVFRVAQGRAAGELPRFDTAEDGAVRGFTLSGFRYTKL
ncbi:MAG TPA: serine hydrolase domain-containing protein [Dehalococcoidia bacterium]|jgi:CubicO group peptidase (beta-lactamase class C family)